MKLAVGDRVQVLRNRGYNDPLLDRHEGTVVEIDDNVSSVAVEVDSDPYPSVRWQNLYYFNESELALIQQHDDDDEYLYQEPPC